MLSAVGGFGQETPPAADEKKYVLFMGSDLAVLRDKKTHRVLDVEGSEFKIKIGKKDFFVPTRNRRTNLKVSHSLKLAAVSVELDGLYAGPAYTPANDPNLKFIRESGAAGGAAAVQDLAYGQMVRASLESGMADAVAAANENGFGAAATRAAADAAAARLGQSMRQVEAINSGMGQDRYNTGALALRRSLELDEGNHDAMEVSFKVSSPVELDDPHMVILFKYQERDAKPGTVGMLIHAEEIDYIGPKPRYVRVRQGGMPLGYKYLDCEVHIFNRGQELATNKSSKRVELTRAEAQQYLVIEHVGANKGKTTPALAVTGSLPQARLKEFSLDQLNRTYYAKVGPDGSVIGLFADESCSLKIDNDATLAAVSEVFFKPALVKGKPVESVARVRLGEI